MKEDNYNFQWKDLGDVEIGRPNLGNATNVSVYRLMQYTMRSVLNKEFGRLKADELFYKAGFVAGEEFCKALLVSELEFYDFVAQLQKILKDLNIGILRVEKSDLEKMSFVITVAEDLDCSGLPITGETVCDYDEGFLAGIFKQYVGREFDVKEVDCWSSGDRVCRFTINLKNGQ
ncbi:hypothetical protein SAMN06265379_1165 [Saccharicrinis carchari]|uniref:4-vinyl reductase 4VR domain-containing protein n=1 Tax=Saccharicrinis carchari TaxID=1168039 RepID=A0A521FAN6_SACCC|nr:V4R domain-containing protein [Saccharicrinis carchari]SMO92570.1 hypothetical protein SAMN06265379_1165 [Saccharicrinis carchari]